MSCIATDGVVPVATADDGGSTGQDCKAVPAFQVCCKWSAQHPAPHLQYEVTVVVMYSDLRNESEQRTFSWTSIWANAYYYVP